MRPATVDRVREAYEWLYGLSRPQNVKIAEELLKSEVQNSQNASACNALGKLYLDGFFVEQNKQLALEYFKLSAKSQNEEGTYRIGTILEVRKDSPPSWFIV